MQTNPPPILVFVANELANFQHHREHLVRAVQRLGWHPVLIAAPVGDSQGLDVEYHPLAIPRFGFDLKRDFLLFFSILRRLRIAQPRALHLINLKPYLYGGLAARVARWWGWKGNVVITVPGLGRLYDTTTHSWLGTGRRILIEALLRVATFQARVTFETCQDRDFWISRRLIHAHQATVTQGAGIDLNRFFSIKSASRMQKTLTVLFASRLLKAKGLGVFFKAAAHLNHPHIVMWIAGEVDQDPDAVPLSEIRAQKNITFWGAVKDMPALLAQTDVVVLPTRYNEGVPRILIEAAASGCVPIATRFPGSEVLIQHEQTGFFLHNPSPDKQAEELVERLVYLSENRERCHEMGDLAAAHVREKGFSAEAVAKAFLPLYTTF